MYYFLDTKFSERRAGYIPYKVNSQRVIKRCKCTACFNEYIEPIAFDIKGALCDYYMVDNQLMISEKFLSVIRDARFTGFNIRNAVVRTWNKVVNEDDIKQLRYYEMVITGRCGLLRNMDGEELPHCEMCGRRISHTGLLTEGVSFNEALYDGSDFFAFDNLWNFPIVSDEVKKILTKSKLTNLKFVPLNEKVFNDTLPSSLIEKWLNEGRVSDELKAVWIRYGIISEDK